MKWRLLKIFIGLEFFFELFQFNPIVPFLQQSLKKDCLLCKNCLRVGHRTSECYSCYVCGRNHKTFSCRPRKPHRPNKPKVWRDSELGVVVKSTYTYKNIYPTLVRKYEKAVEVYNAQLARKANYFVELSKLGMTTKKNFQYEDDGKVMDVRIDVNEDLRDFKKQYKVERKKEIEEDKERYELMNYKEKDFYVPCCSKCGECIGGGCDGHP
ncbi:hypothetical protein Aasi_1746 [Candidatus Amoebophilus asiaticus 5a2]|uniref:Uncharacterized protein n=1 Tax=Amoebophilus asiaticus (strain 5a2) TaxID=452471 RepID=C3L3Y2_AMOA5|nr:hypothetical protein [Candidatus Amoebophilus asiaticus]ACP21023.1 hypothetical protein Aasi_1746 [Candidatus Amoebophilus asiaticus 5a2]